MPGQADKHSQDVKDHRGSWAGHLQHIAEPRQQVGSQEPLGLRKKPTATYGGYPGLGDLSCSLNLPCRSRSGMQSALYLDDVMSGQVRWRAASFLRGLSLHLFCCEFFILILILFIILAGHQREHRRSMIPREGAVKELLPEDGGRSGKGQKGRNGSGTEQNYPSPTHSSNGEARLLGLWPFGSD